VWIKRIVLFAFVNILIVLTISLLMQVLGVTPYMTAYGLDYKSLMIFCLLWGFGGAFISLGISRIMAKMAMGVKVIDPNSATGTERQLVDMVHRLAQAAHLPAMPEVGIYESPEVNAFATGPTKSRSLVAVSRGLLSRMKSAEVEGVLGHEVAHIANGDMVTMTLVQGVVNAFVMFFARVIAFALSQAMRGDRDDRGGSFGASYMLTFVLEIALGFFGMILVAAFSRMREFRADQGGADLAGRGKMIAALQALNGMTQLVDQGAQQSVATMKISAGKPRGFMRLFMTHPPLEERIQRLQESYGTQQVGAFSGR